MASLIPVSSLLCKNPAEKRPIDIEAHSAAFVYGEPPEYLSGPESLSHPGHEAFTNGSMGMHTLSADFAEAPVANPEANAEYDFFSDPGANTPETFSNYDTPLSQYLPDSGFFFPPIQPRPSSTVPSDRDDHSVRNENQSENIDPRFRQGFVSLSPNLFTYSEVSSLGRSASPDHEEQPAETHHDFQWDDRHYQQDGHQSQQEVHSHQGHEHHYWQVPDYQYGNYQEAERPQAEYQHGNVSWAGDFVQPICSARPQEIDSNYGGRYLPNSPIPAPILERTNARDLRKQPKFCRVKKDSVTSMQCPSWPKNLELPSDSKENLTSSESHKPCGPRTNKKLTRYDDGEIIRYGAGESYRPFNNRERDRDRSPRRARSPLRDRDRERERDRDRDRDHRPRTPPIGSDSYVPNRSPRRRSRSPDRYRGPDRARDVVGESWRRRDNSRGRARSPPVRRISPRRSPRRSPGRYSPPLRRDDRFDRARSPRRDFDIRDR